MFSIFLLGLVIGLFAGLFSWLGLAAYLETQRVHMDDQTPARGRITPLPA